MPFWQLLFEGKTWRLTGRENAKLIQLILYAPYFSKLNGKLSQTIFVIIILSVQSSTCNKCKDAKDK